jgi:hypothetical protein
MIIRKGFDFVLRLFQITLELANVHLGYPILLTTPQFFNNYGEC